VVSVSLLEVRIEAVFVVNLELFVERFDAHVSPCAVPKTAKVQQKHFKVCLGRTVEVWRRAPIERKERIFFIESLLTTIIFSNLIFFSCT
jgi:hypothetical protein